MASFGVYLASVSTPIAKTVLSGLGIGVVTYLGLDVIMREVQAQIMANWGQMSQGTLYLMSASGTTQGVGIILGAVAARFSMLQLSALGRIQ